MELSESELDRLISAHEGDMLIMDGGVIRVMDRDSIMVRYLIMGCQVFHQCPNMAITVIDHSVIGLVPACERCKEVVS